MQCIKYFHSTPWEILQILIGEPFLWAKWFLRYPPTILISHWICTDLNDHLDQPAQGRNSAHGWKIWTPDYYIMPHGIINVLSRASEVGSPSNQPGLRAATRHGVRDNYLEKKRNRPVFTKTG